jgi:hypothetical protein
MSNLKQIEQNKRGQVEGSIGQKMKRGLTDKVNEVKAKSKIQEGMQRPNAQKEVKVLENAAHVKSKYTFKDKNKVIPHYQHLQESQYQQKKFLFSCEDAALCEKWIIILTWVIEKKVYLN